MTRLTWNAVGQRFYESGVDRGVLFVEDVGVAWPGLVSVSESPTGGEARPFYIDGYKFLNLAANEEFEATIEAFSAPLEFLPCEGVNTAYAGLLITQQPKKSFHFSYRTRIGNDTDGLKHAYKIHLVYNALAAPSEQTHTTLNNSAEAPARRWSITTLAPKIAGFKPTAHFVVDSRTTSDSTLLDLEDLIYGTAVSAPHMPTVSELLALFEAPAWDGGGVVTSPDDVILDGGAP